MRHRRAVHVLQVVLPVQDAGVEREARAVLLGETAPQRLYAGVGVDDLGLGVHAVEVGVALDEVHARLVAIEPVDRVAHRRGLRHVRHDLLREVDERLGAAEHLLDLEVAGEVPRGHLVLAAAALGQRVRLEVLAHVLVELEEAQRVPVAARHVVVGGLAGRRRGRGHRQDRVHDVVDGDQVDDALRDAGELGDLAHAVGADDRVGHLEAVDPAGRRVLQRRLDDARPHDAQAEAALVREVLDRALPHRLREGVDVGPAERARAHASVLDQALIHPPLAALLGVDADRVGAGAGVLLGGLGHEVLEHLGLAAGRLDLAAGLQRHLRLERVVDLVIERALGDHALLHAGDVGGRDVDEVRRVVVRGAAVEVLRAEDVGLEPLVDRRVEADRGRRVDHDVEAGGDVGLATGEVAVDHVDVAVEGGQEGVVAAQSLTDDVEGRLAGQVVDALDRRRGLLGADQHGRVGVGEVQQEPFEDHLPEEARDAREQDALAREGVHDRASVLYHAADYALSTAR